MNEKAFIKLLLGAKQCAKCLGLKTNSNNEDSPYPQRIYILIGETTHRADEWSGRAILVWEVTEMVNRVIWEQIDTPFPRAKTKLI